MSPDCPPFVPRLSPRERDRYRDRYRDRIRDRVKYRNRHREREKFEKEILTAPGGAACRTEGVRRVIQKRNTLEKEQVREILPEPSMNPV